MRWGATLALLLNIFQIHFQDGYVAKVVSMFPGECKEEDADAKLDAVAVRMEPENKRRSDISDTKGHKKKMTEDVCGNTVLSNYNSHTYKAMLMLP